MAEWQRTHTCGELREQHVGETVVLNGWVHTTRAYNDQVFIDLRDRYGLTQVVVMASNSETFAIAEKLGREFCISVIGTVQARLAGARNDKLDTGAIEVKSSQVIVLNACPTPKFSITEFPDEELANEDIRLQHRYFDLRRPSLQQMLILRHRLNKTIRDYLDDRQFLEIETPILGRSTPEGARDYLVPSRIHEDQWYALPQSPQLYKQLLMIAGYDRYFQIAHCLRDEDLRADRQPEFMQLDLEMSFVLLDDILETIEGLTAAIFQNCLGVEIPTPFPRMPYSEAMLRYGSDKPDLRFGLKIEDVGDIVSESDFTIFRSVLEKAGVVRGINAKGAAGAFSNTELSKGSIVEFVRQYGAGGLAWMKVEADKLTGSIVKNFSAEVQAKLRERFDAEPGDLLLFVADTEHVVCQSLGNLRLHLAERLKLIDPEQKSFAITWVVDFPAFGWDEEDRRWVAINHPFTAPRDEDLSLLESDPGRVKAKAYDLVINGYEAGGGSIRIHDEATQERVFAVLGMTPESSRERFGFLLDALKHGAPPHGGIAFGLDRFCMILAGTSNIRDVIAFPKNQKARDLMTGAPAPVEKRQLRELGLS